LIHVPHAGTSIPDSVRPELQLDEQNLEQEIIRMTDWFTDHLGVDSLELSGLQGKAFINRLSRLVVDPERLPDDIEPMAAIGMGAVYQVTSDLRKLRTPDPARDSALRSKYFDPYTAAFASLVDEVLEVCGEVTIIDLHSYPSTPLDYELEKSARRPEICIGTDPFHTPIDLIDECTRAFVERGFEVGFNSPFAGTYVPLSHLNRTSQVRSVMIEIRRDIYLEESSTTITIAYDEMVSALSGLIRRLDDRRLWVP
jgi:N-formylglutamate amidohydrolase